jgi:serine/threonine protein kinase
VIQPFQQRLEEQAWEVLAQQRPDLAPVLHDLRRAWGMGLSALDELIAQRHLRRQDLRRLLARVPEARERWGDYVVLREEGRGAGGVVYRALRASTRRPCALKVLRPGVPGEAASEQRARRFRQEAALLARLEHPGIVELHDAGLRDGSLYLATEWVPGGSLADRRLQGTPREVLTLGRELAEALQHAHAAGVIHRDLKPANVLLAADGRAKLVDFGLAKDDDQSMTGTGTLLGTPRYAAPEQLGRAREATPAADVYSLAVLLYAELAGEPPFPGDTVSALLGAARRGPPALPPRGDLPEQVRARLEGLFAASLDVDPRIRPPLAGVKAELADCARVLG